jgi:hypothetical protein
MAHIKGMFEVVIRNVSVKFSRGQNELHETFHVDF